MSNNRQPQSEMELRAAVESRNNLRKQSGLPAVELQYELDRFGQAQNQIMFERCMQSPLRYRAEQKLTFRMRRRSNNPDWKPTGFLSGGGLAFHAVLVKHMRKLIARLGTPSA